MLASARCTGSRPRRRRWRWPRAGGYGLTRLLDRIDWKLITRSIERGTRWVGHSDMTTLQLGLLAHGGLLTRGKACTWAGPMAADDFGRETVDDVTQACFLEAMSGELEAVGFRTEVGFDGLGVSGTLWGGNLCMVNSLLGTRHWPRVKGGVLFLEDVNEHPYRIERNLLQLQQAGVLDAQKAIVLGAFSNYKKSPQRPGLHAQVGAAAPACADQDAHPHRPAVRPCADQGQPAGGRAGAAAGAGAGRADRLVTGHARYTPSAPPRVRAAS